jgi:PAS domain S-box-containing protein
MDEIAGLLDHPSLTLWELLKYIIQAVPRHLSRPECGGARLVLRGKDLKSDSFVESMHKIRHDILVEGETVGFIEARYPEDGGGPNEEVFTDADRRLIESTAIHIGRFTELKCSKEAEEQKSSILERIKGFANLGSWEWNLEDNKVAYSDEIIDIWGLDSKEFDSYEDFEQLIHPDDRKVISEHTRRLLEDKMPIDTEFRVLGAEGEGKWIHALCEAVCDESGKPVKITCIMEDVTNRKQAEKALKESEEKYRAIFEEARDGIVLMDFKTGQIIECNPEFERQTGRELEDLKEMKIWEIGPPEKRETARCKFLEVQEKGEGGSSELDFQKPDGETLPVEFNAKVVGLCDQPFIQAIVRDISNRKLAEEATRKSKELFEKIFATQSDAILLLDEGRPPTILDCNPAAERMFGYERDELIGNTTAALHLNEDRMWEFGERISDDVTQHGSIELYDWNLKRKDGSVFPSDHSIVRLTDEKGDVVGRVSVVRDITDRKQAEEVRERFLSNITHELRTPLTSIEGYSDLLLSGKIGELNVKHRKCVEVIAEDSDRLRGLIDNTLDLMAMDAGRFDMDISEVSIPRIVDDIIFSLKIELEKKGITLFRKLPPNLGLVKGDAGKLQQLFSNLLMNAIKFTPEGGRIEVRSESDDEFTVIEVSDTGIGISSEDLPNVFDRFYQADSSSTKKLRGIGLGLAICREIVEAHGGEIEAESHIGKGSVFRVTLPSNTEVSNDEEESISG